MTSTSKLLTKLFALALLAQQASSEIVQIEDGAVEGTLMESWTGQSFHAFLRIPFAEAPVRFQPPVKAQPWNGTLDGTDYGPSCVQPNFWNVQYGMKEDCLQLNVFTKNIPVNEAQLKPVIAYIHGGSYVVGSAIESGPDYLMDRDIVFVTINYRLGALGFLATGSQEAPGNAALKDQVLALKWIQNNIKNFGGDPNKVTIAGLSAGAMSTTSLMASPMAEGLFHGVIAMSGAITWQLGLQNHQLAIAESLARQLNCTTATPSELVACLKTVSCDL